MLEYKRVPGMNCMELEKADMNLVGSRSGTRTRSMEKAGICILLL